MFKAFIISLTFQTTHARTAQVEDEIKQCSTSSLVAECVGGLTEFIMALSSLKILNRLNEIDSNHNPKIVSKIYKQKGFS